MPILEISNSISYSQCYRSQLITKFIFPHDQSLNEGPKDRNTQPREGPAKPPICVAVSWQKLLLAEANEIQSTMLYISEYLFLPLKCYRIASGVDELLPNAEPVNRCIARKDTSEDCVITLEIHPLLLLKLEAKGWFMLLVVVQVVETALN